MCYLEGKIVTGLSKSMSSSISQEYLNPTLYWRLESAWTPKFRLGRKQVLSALEVDNRLKWKKASQISIECRLTTLIPLIGEFNPCILGCVVFLRRFTSTSKNRLPLIGGVRKGREWEEKIHFHAFLYIGNNWVTLISGLDRSVGTFNTGIKFWESLKNYIFAKWGYHWKATIKKEILF